MSEGIRKAVRAASLVLAAIPLARAATAAADAPKAPRFAHVVDLTHTLSARFPVIPVPGLTFPFEQKPIATVEKNGVFANEWHMIEHNGTHIDAPVHFIPGAASMEALAVKDLVVPAIVIDLQGRARTDPDATLTVADIRAWEGKHGPIPENAAVFMNSGWADKAVNDPKGFVNLDQAGRTHFPGFAPEAVQFLVTQRRISGIGVDTLSFDPAGTGATYPAHKILFRGGKWGIENLAGLDRIPPVGSTVFVGALKVEGASASPIRVLAVW